MTLNKTEQRIMAEIESKGYAIISWGHVQHSGRRGLFGMRDSTAMHTLVSKGLVLVEKTYHDTDAHRGRTNSTYDARLVRA